MTTRRRQRRGRQHPALLIAAAGLGALAVVDVARAVAWLLAIAAAGAIVYAVHQHRRPARVTGPAPVRPAAPAAAWDGTISWTGGPVVAPSPAHGPDPARLLAENDQLRAERDDLARQAAGLRRQLAEANDAAHAAWDAAASVTVRPPVRDDTQPLAATLLADPLSGVRRLGPR